MFILLLLCFRGDFDALGHFGEKERNSGFGEGERLEEIWEGFGVIGSDLRFRDDI